MERGGLSLVFPVILGEKNLIHRAPPIRGQRVENGAGLTNFFCGKEMKPRKHQRKIGPAAR